MDLERSEYEPDEYDPEAEFHDPDSESLTIPSAPEVDTDAEVPSDVKMGFWLIVATLKVAILATAAGATLLAVGQWTQAGSAGVLAGLLLFVLAARRYRSVTRSFEEDDGRESEDGTGNDRTEDDP